MSRPLHRDCRQPRFPSRTTCVTSIVGLSAVGAAAILAETGDPTRFTTARALVKHACPAPRERSSGTFTGRTKLTGQGRPNLRLAAWRVVWAARHANPVYAARYQHLTTRETNTLTAPQAQAAITAAILRHLHAVITSGQRWDPQTATHGTSSSAPRSRAAQSLCGGRQADGRGEPHAALRHTMISPLITGSPARRRTNPITRCWGQSHYRYAGTDDGRGSDHLLDTDRLTLMRGWSGRPLSAHWLRAGVLSQPT
ncbi:IS110 family transposase [Kutzneria sp. NPDC051319]|uniref:IS110 family transposase n=1 Tax=Kutzneria sp. NPDC051319 TaxID=3155047 RepID=UPI00341EC4CC